jgi:hypothetical protein
MTTENLLQLKRHFLMLESTVPDKHLLANYLEGLLLVIAENSDELTAEIVQRIQAFIIFFQNTFQEDCLRMDADDQSG